MYLNASYTNNYSDLFIIHTKTVSPVAPAKPLNINFCKEDIHINVTSLVKCTSICNQFVVQPADYNHVPVTALPCVYKTITCTK